MVRERNRDRNRSDEDKKREADEARARGEQPPQDDDRTQGDDQAPGDGQEIEDGQDIDNGPAQPDNRDPRVDELEKPPTPNPDRHQGDEESMWNNPNNVKNAIAYYEDRGREREQERGEQGLDRDDDAGAALEEADRAEGQAPAEQPHQHGRDHGQDIDEDDAGAAIEAEDQRQGEAPAPSQPAQGKDIDDDDAGAALDQADRDEAARGPEINDDRERKGMDID